MTGGQFGDRFNRLTQIFSKPSKRELSRLQSAARRMPDDPHAVLKLCRELRYQGRREDALVVGNNFLKRTGDAHLQPLTSIFRDLGAYEMAEHCCQRWSQLSPNEARPVSELGMLLALQGDAPAARKELERATKIEPNNPETWYKLGTFLLRQRDLESAQENLRHALLVEPTYARAHTNLGFLLDLRGERHAALREFQRALQLAPRDPENHFNLGALYAESKSYDLAIDQFRAGLALSPRRVEGQYNLGAVFFGQRRYDEAIHCFRSVLRLEPRHSEALYYLGLSFLRKGVYDRALEALENASSDHAPSVRLLYGVALCYNGLELPRKAVQVLTKVLALAPDHAKAHHILGICFDKLGERDRAVEAYRKSDLFLSLAKARRGGAKVLPV